MYGPNYTKKLSLDLAPLLPFLAESVSSKFEGRSVDILRTYAYGIKEDRSLINNYNNSNSSSSSNGNTHSASSSSSSGSNGNGNSSANEPGRFNFIRAAINERFPVRAFSGPPSSSSIISSISMTADIVHSAAIHPTRSILKNSNDIIVADIDSGTPISMMRTENSTTNSTESASSSTSTSSSSSVSHLKPFDIVICISSFRYLPAMVRAAQHGKSVFLATSLPSSSSSSGTSSSVSTTSNNTMDSSLSVELWNNSPNSIQNLITRVRIEDVLPRIIRPASDFRTGAPSLQSIALRIGEAIAKESGNAVAGNRLLSLVMDISKDLSRHRLSIKALVSRFPNAFSIEEQSTKYWVKLRPNWRTVLTTGSNNDNISTSKVNGGRTTDTLSSSNDKPRNKGHDSTNTNGKKGNVVVSPSNKTEEVSASTPSTENLSVKEPQSQSTVDAPTILTPTGDAPATVTVPTKDSTTTPETVVKKRGRKPKASLSSASTTTESTNENNTNKSENNTNTDNLQQLVVEANKQGIISLTDENSKKALARPILQQIARTCLPAMYRSSMNKGDLITLLQTNMEQVRQSLSNRAAIAPTTVTVVTSETVAPSEETSNTATTDQNVNSSAPV